MIKIITFLSIYMLYNIKSCIFALEILTQKKNIRMLKEKAGALAGQIWEALNGTEGLTQKQIKKAAKMKADKDFFLGMGWLLREDKVAVSEVEGEIFVKLV